MIQEYLRSLLPEILLVAGASVVLLSGPSRSARARKAASWTALLTIAAALVCAWQSGFIRPAHDTAPFGVRLGPLALYVRLVALSVGLLVVLVNLHLPNAHDRREHLSMILFALAGVLLTAVADDLITLFLALELASVPTYALVAAGRDDLRAPEAGLKYFFLGALAAAFLLYGFSFLYGAGGTLRLSVLVGAMQVGRPWALVGLVLVLAGLGFKIAAVPLHAYAPDVYQGAASPVTGLLGFFPKVAGFVALIRLLAMVPVAFVDQAREVVWIPPDVIFWILWAMAAATMTLGNCVALMQTNVKRILAYSSIAHSGTMLVGVLVGPAPGAGPMRDGWSAVLFYLVTYGVANLGAFGILAYLHVRSKPAEELEDLAGLARTNPASAAALAVCLFSLMGMPPAAGFFGKLCIFSGALSVGNAVPHRLAMIVLAVIGVLNSAVAAAYYLRVIAACYLREPQENPTPVPSRALRLGITVCATFSVLVGLWPRDLLWLAGRATAEIQPPAGYPPVRPLPDAEHAADSGRAVSVGGSGSGGAPAVQIA